MWGQHSSTHLMETRRNVGFPNEHLVVPGFLRQSPQGLPASLYMSMVLFQTRKVGSLFPTTEYTAPLSGDVPFQNSWHHIGIWFARPISPMLRVQMAISLELCELSSSTES